MINRKWTPLENFFAWLGTITGSAITLAAIFLAAVMVSCTFTGPCAGKGLVASQAQDYVVCGNGVRMDAVRSHGNTATYEVKVDEPR